MKEAFLHHLWKYRKFEGAASTSMLKTACGKELQIVNTGSHNELSGPDFFNAQVRIDGQLWAGNVEIHIKSSDWYLHNHEQDAAYDNVILHVVWEDDCAVFDKAEMPIPSLILQDKVAEELLFNYKHLLETKSYHFINCESRIPETPNFLFENWMERLFFERLERKVLQVEQLLNTKNGDWEAVLFTMLARNFGTVINADAFEDVASVIDFKTIRKLSSQKGQLEGVFLGLAGLLPEEADDLQIRNWKTEYKYNQHKYRLASGINQKIQFFKLRPPNFPTIRLSQLAQLYEKNTSLFSLVLAAKTRDALQNLFSAETSTYWETHYNFAKTHKKRTKKTTPAFIDILIINTLVPIKFAYAKTKGQSVEEDLVNLMLTLPQEVNSITTGFIKLRSIKKDALHSQALIQLKKTYCDQNRCLHCQIGNYLLNEAV